MIDITVIASNSNHYSVKYDLNKNTNSATINILQVDQVEPIGLTNYKKIRTVFEKQSGSELLNRDRYSTIYNNLAKKITQKYKISSVKFI